MAKLTRFDRRPYAPYRLLQTHATRQIRGRLQKNSA